MKNYIKISFLLLILPFFSLSSLSAETQALQDNIEKSPRDYYRNPAPLDFKNILVIINYNHPYYRTIPFLKEIYSPIFPNIVFYGEEPHPEVNVMPHHFGWYGQSVIVDAMKKWPNYEGYMCVQDDCVMNFWNFARFDKKKIWFAIRDKIDLEDVTYPWIHWQLWYGRPKILEGFAKLNVIEKTQLIRNLGKNKTAYSFHDFVYIPRKYRKRFISVSKVFEEAFIELAIPNILLSISNKKEWEKVNLLWGPENLFQEYSTKYDWVHPFKFSQSAQRDFITEIFNNRTVE